MAKRAITIYVDDLDGTESESGETVIFSFRGQHYEIDLSVANVVKMEKVLAPYIAKSRPRSAGRVSTVSKPARTGVKAAEEEKSRNERSLIRSWFNGLTEAQRASIYRKGGGGVAPERGRIAEDIVTAYGQYRSHAAATADVSEARQALTEAAIAAAAVPAEVRAGSAVVEAYRRTSVEPKATPGIPALPAVVKATEPKTAPRKPRKPKPAVPPVAHFQAASGQAGRLA